MTNRIITDIEGVIRELSISEVDVLFPLYEAVVNAIQAIDERKDNQGGKIGVYIERDKSEQSLFEQFNSCPISSIRIIDNGIGFTSSNIESFGKAHSTKKINIGGKGLGRFAMLSVFSKIMINSVIRKSADENEFISFTLSRTEGLSEPERRTTKKEIQTEIILSELDPKFQKATAQYSQEEIADSILSHCLLYYLRQNVPIIEVVEDKTVINLSRQFSPADFVKKHYQGTIGEYKFDLYFVHNDKSKVHEYCLCGHNRKVKGKRIDTIFPIFSSEIEDNNESYFVQLYVVSTYLDEIVNMSRNEFKFPKKLNSDDYTNQLDFSDIPQTIFEKDIEQLIIKAINETYTEIVNSRKDNIKQQIEKYLHSDDGLEYRHLMPDEDFFSTIPDNADEKKLDDILHAYQYKRSREVRKKRDKLFSRDYSNRKDYQALLKEVVEATTNEGNSRLAQYIAHRKTIISLLDKYLQWSDEKNNYEEEATLHNLIYTMGGSHDSIAYDKHNLWLLDDRLTFHRYIYSDIQIKSHEPVKNTSSSKKETDIAIYDKSFYYGEKNDYEEINSIVIFEFKRPNRTVTFEEFSKQMREQIMGIQESRLIDSSQQHIQTSESTPVFFYYVCDVNSYASLRKSALFENFRETPYKSLIRLSGNVHVEIFTYQTLMINAKRRNKIFFKKLGLE